MDKKALIKALRDTVQSASNSVAGGVSAPVDLIAAGLRKVGLPIPQAPVGGSQWMENVGLTIPVEEGIPKMAGETLGMIVPMAATAKAPQIAAAANRGLENLAAPRTLNTPGYGGQRGAIVWHGSPHKFDAFDASKIGTGEGAQAYGHGMYFAESPDVAKSYQQALSSAAPAKRVVSKSGGDLDAALQAAQSSVDGYKALIASGGGGDMRRAQRMLSIAQKKVEDIQRMRAGLPENTGVLYKVDLPDEAIARMLDWDKPLSQQAPGVQKALLQTGDKTIAMMINEKPVSVNNGEYWSYLGNTYNSKAEALADSTPFQLTMGRTSIGETPAEVSKRLQATGIPGIRYLDQSSRGAGAGTSNFVVFPGEERLLRILERNNQPMGLMGAPKQSGIQPLTTLNPTGSVFTNYDPISRATAPLGKNITTLDKTMGGLADDTVTIYRGAPKTQKTINPGDFITTDAQLARDYAGTGHVISQKVRKKDILDDMLEPLGGEYIYRPTK